MALIDITRPMVLRALKEFDYRGIDAMLERYSSGPKGKSIRWYRKAAEQGDADAQYNPGVMYDKGEGVPEDDIQADRRAPGPGNRAVRCPASTALSLPTGKAGHVSSRD